MPKPIKGCRICQHTTLTQILDLGEMELSGVFPASKEQEITSGPLRLTKCMKCGLVQLDHDFPLDEMYGENYGYRSGLNQSMVSHLENSVNAILERIKLSENDIVVDIGSNDGTLLSFYTANEYKLVGMDPTSKKFKEYYRSDINRIEDFFNAESFKNLFPNKKAKIITSFSMFYDLPAPQEFVNQISEILDQNGLWVFEQSYLPLMIERMSFDTICHEHLEYYCLEQIKYMLDRANLKIIDVEFNDINGGSFKVYAAHAESSVFHENKKKIEEVLKQEISMGYSQISTYKIFEKKVFEFKEELLSLIKGIKDEGKTIVALGASTKGNVLLQFCNLDYKIIDAIAEVNPFKFGKLTPGTHIPILSEQEIKQTKPDFKLILPWHFRETFLNQEKDYLDNGGSLIFPLPKTEVISKRELGYKA